MEIHVPDQAGLKCPTCFQTFAILEEHKKHYKSDFHRYNLKRKMVKLAPITEQQFKAKKIQSHVEQNEGYKCNECGKKFNSSQTLNQHASSKNHNPNKQVMKEANQTNSAPKNPQPYKKNANVCLFCKNEAQSFELNLRHMEGSHSFFIPQEEFCTNKKGLMEYLQEKIEVGFMCITCENKKAKDFATGEAVRKHMVDKGHTFMKSDEGFEEYEKYYDFSKQFQELLQLQKNMNVPGISYTKVKVYANGKNNTDEDIEHDGQQEWEDEDEDSEQWEDQDEEDEGQDEDQEIQQEDGCKKQKRKKKVITYNIMKPTMTSNDELLLPNGKILGHRKYRFLYRQSYRNPFWLEDKLKAIGWNGQAVTHAIQSRQKMMEMARNERLMYKTNLRRDKIHLRNGMQNNLLMKFFRCQNSL